MDTSLHPIQSQILIALLFKSEARFSELNTTRITTDHFNFHVQRLIELNLIHKNTKGLYELTSKGKEYANRYDDEKAKIEKQPKVTVMILGIKKEKKLEYMLMQKRLKHPYYGYFGVASGKIRFGETVYEAAMRELQEETGLAGKLELIGIEHKMDYDTEGIILDDKVFFIFKGTNLQGKFITSFKGGENIWVEKNKVSTLENLFDDVNQVIKLLDSNKLEFLENKFSIKNF